jgi:hypothetical protein
MTTDNCPRENWPGCMSCKWYQGKFSLIWMGTGKADLGMAPSEGQVPMSSFWGWMSCMPATHPWIWGTMCYAWVRKKCLYGAPGHDYIHHSKQTAAERLYELCPQVMTAWPLEEMKSPMVLGSKATHWTVISRVRMPGNPPGNCFLGWL